MTFQIPRRRLFAMAGASLLAAMARPRIAAAQTAAPSGAPALTASEQLLHTVVRIQCPTGPTSFTSGTGFFFGFFAVPGSNVTAIVTNKHVIIGHDSCDLVFTGLKADGSPDIDAKIPVTVTDLAKIVIPHPDPAVDLAIIPIGGVLAELEKRGTPAYIRLCDDSAIPSGTAFAALTPLEDILTVGFPGGVWDTAHNLPVFHRGITATPAYVDFQGEKKFLIDAAVWPGASGSPVYLYEQGALYDARANAVGTIGYRLMLLGIVSATVVQDMAGNVLVQAAPTSAQVNTLIPSNLGVCIRSSRVLDFQPLLIGKGAKVPAEFKMRGSES